MQIISSYTILSMLVLNVLCDITISPAKVTAIPGLCAHISCTFTYQEEAKPMEIRWKGKENQSYIFRWDVRENQVEENETGWIKIIEPDLTKNNCSIIMEDIKGDEKQFEIIIVDEQNQTHSSAVNISIKERPSLLIPTLMEGVEVNLTCSAPFPCPENPPNITWWIKTREENVINLENTSISLSTFKRVYRSNLTLIPTSDLANATVGCDVSYGNKSISTNKTIDFKLPALPILVTVKEGDTLNLTCTIKSHPPLTDPGSFNGTTDKLKNQTSAENHTIANVEKGHDGVYICEMTKLNKTLNVTVVISITGATGVDNMGMEDQKTANKSTDIISFATHMPNILTFVAGMACSAFIFSVILCCWVCCRRGKKLKVPTANLDDEINMETVQTDVALNGTTEQTPLHEQPDGESPAPKYEAEEDEVFGTEEREVDYANIDYSLLKERSPDEAQKEPVNTDYAEIKKDRRGERKKSEDPQDGDAQTSDQTLIEGEEEIYSKVQ